MPTLQYPTNPNTDTAFVVQDDGTKNRALMIAPQDISTLELPNNPNSTKGYITVDGKKQRVILTADITGGGGDKHNLGYYADLTALQTAYPTGQDGDFAILGSTDTVWIWDSGTTAWVDSDQKGQVTSVNNKTGAVTIGAADVLPSQTGNAGKFLQTNGSVASWGNALQNTATGTGGLAVNTTKSNTFNYTTAVGYDSKASSTGSTAVGAYSKASNGSTGYGYQANASGVYAVAVGDSSYANGEKSNAIGSHAYVNADGATQIGYGTNNNANTFSVANKISNYELMSADGTVPTARLTKVNTTVTLAAASWSSNTQTVNVTGMTADGVVFPCPVPADQADYTDAGIICSAQAAGTLTFTCDTTPTNDIDVQIVML